MGFHMGSFAVLWQEAGKVSGIGSLQFNVLSASGYLDLVRRRLLHMVNGDHIHCGLLHLQLQPELLLNRLE